MLKPGRNKNDKVKVAICIPAKVENKRGLAVQVQLTSISSI